MGVAVPLSGHGNGQLPPFVAETLHFLIRVSPNERRGIDNIAMILPLSHYDPHPVRR
jgi:hypothetical protein